MRVLKADIGHLDLVSEVFNQYRVFYEQQSDIESCRDFLRKRMEREESVIFLAVEEQGEVVEPLGFTQIYPIFSSVSLKTHWLLNDLFVAEKARRRGIGEELLNHAKQLAESTGAKGVTLETAHDNYNAQKLYEKFGFVKHTEFHYTYSL
ncbi:GNAT family N-acetyltransferase [Rossellomorea vietnamensis]|uniref:GNAT family N-acetyltransferase n=1 Tax=Rossellomorea vietnamensis TaxID=218284 RepID=A0A5D4KHJ8_9BACI|nr:GNAT family N-acetyltransferase [Rossellomorea vietnamensis]TYR75753.1 GNAT family N-acetyltransferase [Rossellomorea vietnamensis]